MEEMSYFSADGLFAEQWRFLRRLAVNPRRIGAIAPSGPSLARAMVAQVDTDRPGPILELGPGSGAMTRELLSRGLSPGRLTVIEHDPAFAKLVAERFTGVNVLQGDAFDLDRTLAGQSAQKFTGVISGLPLLNHPPEKRQALLGAILSRLEPGAPFVQFSYGRQQPVSPPAGATVKCAAFIWRNLPPARVWVYRRS